MSERLRSVKLGIRVASYAKYKRIDNKREMLYTRNLQPYVVKVYECTPSGLIAITEFVDIFTLNEFHEHQEEMAEILNEISKNFLIGDVGITGKNYVNWGTRNDGTICILDFAYIYSVQYKVFSCACNDDALLRYDSKYVKLICPYCGRSYTFGEIRRKITRKQQDEEIGDIRRLSYNIHSEEETVELVPDFEPRTKEKKKKQKSEIDLLIKEKENKNKEEVIEWDDVDPDSI